MYCIVAPFGKTFDDIGITYFVPNFLVSALKVGNIVEIPLKESVEIGVVLNITKELNANFDASKIKSVIAIRDIAPYVFLTNYQKELIPWFASYYFSLMHHCIALFFPKNVREKLEKMKLNYPGKTYQYSYENKNSLTHEQKKAFDEINNHKETTSLLYGLTGSGKTQIYIELIKNMLDEGKQTLLLIPEIILTNQVSEKIKAVFGKDVLVIHSFVSDATKTKYWIDIMFANAKIIVGTRSALFYPFSNLGLIIIDEEHDMSYISDKTPRYHTIEVAQKISQLNGNKLVLGSGTPSITSMYKAVTKEYELIHLLKKF